MRTAEVVPEANKLIKLQVDLGEGRTRQIFAGLRAFYPDPQSLVGQNVIVVANLKPRQMKFGLSEGMVLAAGGPEGSARPHRVLSVPGGDAQPGDKGELTRSAPGLARAALPHLLTNAHGRLLFVLGLQPLPNREPASAGRVRTAMIRELRELSGISIGEDALVDINRFDDRDAPATGIEVYFDDTVRSPISEAWHHLQLVFAESREQFAGVLSISAWPPTPAGRATPPRLSPRAIARAARTTATTTASRPWAHGRWEWCRCVAKPASNSSSAPAEEPGSRWGTTWSFSPPPIP